MAKGQDMLPPKNMKIVFDTELRRPGCVLLQAAFGCGYPNLANQFPSETWLVQPTEHMRVFEVTAEQVPKLVEMSKKVCAKEIKKREKLFADLRKG